MFEALLKAICTTILKKALRRAGFHTAASVVQVISYFDSIASISDCANLGVAGVEVGYSMLSDAAVDYLVRDVVEDRYDIRRTSSGLYAAHSKIVTQEIRIADPHEYAGLFIPTREIPVRFIPTREI